MCITACYLFVCVFSQLPHSLVDETTSVCLFVRDEDRNNRDYSVTVDKLKEELDSAGVKQQIQVTNSHYYNFMWHCAATKKKVVNIS